MRINKLIANNTSFSRRQADKLIADNRVRINEKLAELGSSVSAKDVVYVDGKKIENLTEKPITVLLHKPVGFVCSKDGQGSPTVYDLLPSEYHNLNIAGRLDKDSSGLVVLTSDGNLLQDLTHPSNNKEKIYEVKLDKELNQEAISKLRSGVDIDDSRISKFKNILKIRPKEYQITIEEGRNRQIRRTFEKIDNRVVELHRSSMGRFVIGDIPEKQIKIV